MEKICNQENSDQIKLEDLDIEVSQTDEIPVSMMRPIRHIHIVD